MSVVIVAAISAVVMSTLAYQANIRFHHEDRLPMQWWFTGEVTWSAPRRLALAFMPALAIIVFGAFAGISLNFPARPGQEGLVVLSMMAMGILLVLIQLLHFTLIAKTLRRNSE